MSYPILYLPTETNFDHNGLGILTDCVSCFVTEEKNGIFELEMKYPMDGIHFEEIFLRSIVKARANAHLPLQLFRVYSKSKPNLSGIVTFYAEHISYDLSGIPVAPFEANDILSALIGLKQNAVSACPFEFTTDKTVNSKFVVQNPSSIRHLLGGSAGSLLDVYGGEYVFDNYSVILKKQRGTNKGVTIRYGKNLTDINQEENISSVATGVYPYWKPAEGVEGQLVMLDEKIVNVSGTYNFTRIVPLDLSGAFTEQPTKEQLKERAEKYIADNSVGIPKVNIKVSFSTLTGNGDISEEQSVDVGDTVSVYYTELGVQATAECIKVVYDSLLDKYLSVQLGDAKKNVADTIFEQQNQVQSSVSSAVNKAVYASNSLTEKLNQLIANSLGFYTTVEKDEFGRRIEYYHDKPQLVDSKIIYKMSIDGFATSTDGGETWNGGITPDGNIVAKIIEAVKIVSPTNPNVYIDLLNGDISTTGKYVATAEVFFEPGIKELNTVKEHILNINLIPSSKIPLYDLDGNGAVTTTEFVKFKAAAMGKDFIGTGWDGAQKSVATITIDVSDPQKAVRIQGINMWGNPVDKYFGVNSLFTTSDAYEQFDEMVADSPEVVALKNRMSTINSENQYIKIGEQKICWGQIIVKYSAGKSNGLTYYGESTEVLNGAFPVSFENVPVVIFTVNQATTAVLGVEATEVSNNGISTVRLHRANAYTDTAGLAVNYIAIGK